MSKRSMSMDSSKPDSVTLRSTSTISLHQRFSQVLGDQLTHSRLVSYDPHQLQQRVDFDPPVMVLVLKEEPICAQVTLKVKQCLKRRSVWTRLGWQQVAQRHSGASRNGFWSFRNKYRFRAGFRSRFGFRAAYRRGQPDLSLQRGDVTEKVPTKKQLDAQLDDYMSLSKNQLDKRLDDYMSLSRSRLDAELDEYMSAAGQAPLYWA